MKHRIIAAFLCACAAGFAAEPFIPSVPDKQPEPPFPPTPKDAGVQMLVPGFTVRELPVKLTNLNNIEYAPDGRLFAGGYDGRFHLLRDTDGDGLEDKVITFSPEANANYPLGMIVKDGNPYAVLTDEVVRWVDSDGDGVPDKRETVIKGFDDPALVKAPYLMHRRVDSSMALAAGPDGALYVTMGNGAPTNAYWNDKAGAHYSTDKRRGCLLRISPEGKVEQLASGLRYIMSLQFNQHGDLFGTDQEGATWVPNGNPFDELLHLQAGRHYGFPPRHPKWLPDVIDEPSVWDFAPQHQSTCGFRFNGPAARRGRFGPEFWAGDAIVTGESRGKLWRTKLAKTAAGYVAHSELIAVLGMLAVDCAISPAGDLVVCCHSGDPDWGNGPQGEGRIFKISYTDKAAPQPVLTYALTDAETFIEFDRPLDPEKWKNLATRTKVEAGRYVSAADRLEKMRPGYAVVKMQQAQPRTALEAIYVATVPEGKGSLLVRTGGRTDAINYAITIAGESTLDVAHDLTGLTYWLGTAHIGSNGVMSGWLPHLDFTAARELTRGSKMHDAFWKEVAIGGSLTLLGQLDLWQMLTPATQPLSKLDYTPEPETVTVVFKRVLLAEDMEQRAKRRGEGGPPHGPFKPDDDFYLDAPGAKLERVSENEARLTVTAPKEGYWQPFTLSMGLIGDGGMANPKVSPRTSLDVSYFTNRDPRPRALPARRILMPFAMPGSPDERAKRIPEIAGGDWQAGRELFKGKATCATCHQLRGDGVRVGPELGNLPHRDYASVLKDIADPNASINPDAVGYVVTLKDGATITGTRIDEDATHLFIAQPGGDIAQPWKADIASTEPMKTSLMPAGLDKALTPEELRDLMTYLLLEAAPTKGK
ncbi:MAG: c-type cytochrome [Chthoniobacter sp.]|nr:c-type cytochrome [Chthoniobacter sp.]